MAAKKPAKNAKAGLAEHTRVEMENYDLVRDSYKKIAPGTLTQAEKKRLAEIKLRNGIK
jgi:hypothetical protein